MISYLNKLWKKNIWLPIAGLVFLIQLLVPAYMIFEQQQTLKYGELHKFKIRPIDPYDPFRGRYVVLSFEAVTNAIPYSPHDKIAAEDVKSAPKRNDWVYAIITTDEKGYAKFSELKIDRPKSDENFLRVQIRYSNIHNSASIIIPFDRYYAPENKAYSIEDQVRRRSRNSQDNVYVAVRVRNGKGTIEDLYINEVPILEFVESNQKKAN